MTVKTADKYSAGEQGLGYIYQARLALLQLLQLPVDTVPVVNKKNRKFDAARPSVLYRTSQMLTDFQKSVDRSVNLSPTALCLSEARDLLPSPWIKSRSSSFSRKIAVSSGN